MPSIVLAAKLTRAELRQLGVEVVYAVDRAPEDQRSGSRSVEVHDLTANELPVPVAVHHVFCATPTSRPAA
jgi:hypothetical protein